TKRNFASLAAPARKASCPVDKLSHPTTAIPSASKRSQRLLPINPAAPVTNAFLIGEHCLLFNLSSPVASVRRCRPFLITDQLAKARRNVHLEGRCLHRLRPTGRTAAQPPAATTQRRSCKQIPSKAAKALRFGGLRQA